MNNKRIVLESIEDLVCEIEGHDKVTGLHSRRVEPYFAVFAKRLMQEPKYRRELVGHDFDIIVACSGLHDVGKLRVLKTTLTKRDKLSDEEFMELRTHPSQGVGHLEYYEKITGVDLPLAKIMAGEHQEKWDGGGYPNRLQGEKIHLLGRIMAIVDTYEAIVANRPYRENMKGSTHEEAFQEVVKSFGTQLDPNLENVFKDCEKAFKHENNKINYEEEYKQLMEKEVEAGIS